MSSKTKSSVCPKVQIQPVFDYDKVDYGTSTDVHLDVVLKVPEKQDETRTPLHMVLAIDCSGSMSGSKIGSVKDTLNRLVNNLTENDTITMIGFSTNCWEILPVTPMSNINKKQALEAIKNISTHNMTNLEEAIKWSIERAATADKKKVSRIVLLTDGLPTIGDQTHDGLVSVTGLMGQSVSLTTFGYGNDYDPELLVSLASKGRGNHFYIQFKDDCKKAFALELGGLLSMALQDVKVSVTPTGNFEIIEFISDYEHTVEEGYRGLNSGKIFFTIDDIYYGESKHAIIKIKVPKASQAVCARPTTVCNIEVDGEDIESKKRIKSSGKARINYVKSSQIPKNANEEVKKQLLFIEAAKIHKEAKKKADEGNYQAATALYAQGADFAANNSWFDGADNLAESFKLMERSSSDHFTYSSIGSKLSNSYTMSFSRSRASSSSDIGASNVYMSSVQRSVMDSFDVDPVTISMTGDGSGESDPKA